MVKRSKPRKIAYRKCRTGVAIKSRSRLVLVCEKIRQSKVEAGSTYTPRSFVISNKFSNRSFGLGKIGLRKDRSLPSTSLKINSPRSKKFTAIGSLLSYTAALAVIAVIASIGYRSPIDQQEVAVGISQASIETTKPSVDQIVATDLAASLAETAKLPVATHVANLSISLTAKSTLAQVSDDLVSKPQIFEPGASDRDFKQYQTVVGDNVDKIAAQFGISGNTLRWANNLSSDALEPGKSLVIPAVDGIVYTVRDGDTSTGLATRYQANEQRIVLYNDLETAGLKPGSKILIPSGTLPESERPGYAAPRSNRGSSFAIGSQFASSASVGNRYDVGYCTYYAYERRAALGRPIGSFWGNATSWASYARSAGFSVNNVPEVGAILQSSGGWGGYGHVAVVESISGGEVTISEKNYAGWDVTSKRTIPASQAGGYNYIH